MTQIRLGAKLRPVETNSDRPVIQPTQQGGLAGALARALQERSRVIQQTDESSDDDDVDVEDDEWDD